MKIHEQILVSIVGILIGTFIVIYPLNQKVARAEAITHDMDLIESIQPKEGSMNVFDTEKIRLATELCVIMNWPISSSWSIQSNLTERELRELVERLKENI